MAARWSDDRGETLVELLLAVLIMGIAVVAVVGGLLTVVKLSDVHRKQATGGADARSYAEAVERYVAGDHYADCAGQSAYAPAMVGFAPPGGFAASVSTVEYWNTGTAAFTGTCSAPDTGLQRVTVQVASLDGRATEKAIVVVRKPCGQGSSCS